MEAELQPLSPVRSVRWAYLELEGVSRPQHQVPGDGHAVSVRAAEHHGGGRGGAEAVVAVPLHALVAQHEPHAHLVQRVVERRLLVEVLGGRSSERHRVRITLLCGSNYLSRKHKYFIFTIVPFSRGFLS